MHDLENQIFGRLTVLGRAACDHRNSRWIVECQCGNVRNMAAYELLSGAHTSCGCYNRELLRSRIGDKNPAWRGGVSSENKRIRATVEMEQWRKAIFIRDDYTCQKCHRKGYKLIAHHIYNFADYPALRFDINNGATLCNDCHRKFHHTYGNINNTKKQFDEFCRKELS